MLNSKGSGQFQGTDCLWILREWLKRCAKNHNQDSRPGRNLNQGPLEIKPQFPPPESSCSLSRSGMLLATEFDTRRAVRTNSTEQGFWMLSCPRYFQPFTEPKIHYPVREYPPTHRPHPHNQPYTYRNLLKNGATCGGSWRIFIKAVINSKTHHSSVMCSRETKQMGDLNLGWWME
jgi:hypothetical protein